MNVTFICRTLEAGKCGVGDYTHRLATELVRQGVQASVIALRDNYVTEILEEQQGEPATQIPVLRFPMDTKWNIQIRRIQSFLDQQGSRWLSLQYVPYSIQGKGLHWMQNAFFEQVGKGKYWHIMFHELWLGLNKEASLKEVWWGEAQRHCLLNLVKRLKPASVHTHSRVYQAVLQLNGISALQLPLFSNIDPIPGASQTHQRSDNTTFVAFASIRECAKRDRFLEELEAENQRKGRTSHFVFIGRSGQPKKQWIQAIEKKQSLTFEDLGTLEAEAVSFHLSKADIGLSFTPMLLSEKSGALACYRAHALPVLCLADDWNTRKSMELKVPENVVAYREGHLPELLETCFSSTNTYKGTSDVAAQFLRQTTQSVNTINHPINH